MKLKISDIKASVNLMRDKKGFICDINIIARIKSEIDTYLVSGITKYNEIDQFAIRPLFILNGVEDIIKS